MWCFCVARVFVFALPCARRCFCFSFHKHTARASQVKRKQPTTQAETERRQKSKGFFYLSFAAPRVSERWEIFDRQRAAAAVSRLALGSFILVLGKMLIRSAHSRNANRHQDLVSAMPCRCWLAQLFKIHTTAKKKV